MSLQSQTNPSTYLPNGLRPVFDVWSTQSKEVLHVKYDVSYEYSVTDTRGNKRTLTVSQFIANLETGVYATLQENHDQ